MDLIDMNNENILIQKRPNLDKLSKHDKEHIAGIIMEIWAGSLHAHQYCLNAQSMRKLICFSCCCFMVILVAMIAVLESNIYIVRTTSQRTKLIIAICLGLCSII